MAAEFVTVTWTELDIGGTGLYGQVRFTLSGAVSISGAATYEPVPLAFPIINSAGSTSPPILANDSPGAAPPNSYYTVSVGIHGQPPRVFTTFIDFANGATQNLASLTPVVPPADYAAFMPLSGGQFTGAVAGSVVTVTDGPAPTINAGLANHFRWVLGANRAVPLPSGGFDGQLVLLDLIQDGTGGRTVTWAGGYDFGAASLPVLSTAAHAEDTVGLQCNTPAGGWKVLAFGPGYKST